jgi:hypothetical protein
MWQLRVLADQIFERRDEARLIFSRLEVSNHQNIRSGDGEPVPHESKRNLTRDWPELRANTIWNHANPGLIQLVGLCYRTSGEFTGSEHASGGLHRSLDGQLQLKRPHGRKVLGMLKKAYIVDADHHGRGTRDGRCVLHMDQVGPVLPQAPREIVT